MVVLEMIKVVGVEVVAVESASCAKSMGTGSALALSWKKWRSG